MDGEKDKDFKSLLYTRLQRTVIGVEFVITAVWGEIILVAICKKHGSGRESGSGKWQREELQSFSKRSVIKLLETSSHGSCRHGKQGMKHK